MKLILGDCLKEVPKLMDDSIDSIVTDPPAGISFMGKGWDKDRGGRDNWITWLMSIMDRCRRKLKSGGHILVWAIPRTSHWTATAIENAGFVVKDIVTHIFGSGYPKSTDISKQMDKMAGAKRDRIKGGQGGENNILGKRKPGEAVSGKAITPEAEKWNGWGTALKPAHENWILAQKPISEKNIAANVLKYGTGGINIDGCKIGNKVIKTNGRGGQCGPMPIVPQKLDYIGTEHRGRFPSNLILSHHPDCELMGEKKVKGSYLNHECGDKNELFFKGKGRQKKKGYASKDGTETVEDWKCVDGCPVKELDKQSGILKSGDLTGQPRTENKIYGSAGTTIGKPRFHKGDFGGASRFFYCMKPSRHERNEGLEWMKKSRNFHPTIKAVKLMRYLCRLITPPGGTVLDPFMGTGSTGIAAKKEGFDFIGIEQDKEYFEMAKNRIGAVYPLFDNIEEGD